jgi:molybdopterin/thiamine biosynthesis adenylyltransferase
VHGSAIRWRATVWAVAPEGRPCYRCLFEDLPGDEAQPNCAEAGVMGPVVGLAGALMADLALCVLCDEAPYGKLFAYEGRSDTLRRVDVAARRDCPLCGSTPSIIRVDEARYMSGICAA